MIHETRDTNGRQNGVLIPLWSALEYPELRPDQVYVTTVDSGFRKGPHLHRVRRSMFYCIVGSMRIRCRTPLGEYADFELCAGDAPLVVLPGAAAALYNVERDTAVLVNMPSPAWSPDEPDEHEVTDWSDPAWWTGKP